LQDLSFESQRRIDFRAHFTGKTIFITGASSGIGRGVAISRAESVFNFALDYFGTPALLFWYQFGQRFPESGTPALTSPGD
jgi:hypothetical protein